MNTHINAPSIRLANLVFTCKTEYYIVSPGSTDVMEVGFNGCPFHSLTEAEQVAAEIRALGGKWDIGWQVMKRTVIKIGRR